MALSSSTPVVVIGGTSGIGLAVARSAAAAGAPVTVGSRSVAALPEGVTGRAVDVTDPGSVAAFFAATGPFEHLVYTAGDDLVRGPITDYDPGLARDFFEVRLFRALDVVRLALPTLRPSGSITLTGGAAAFHPGPGRLLGATVSGAVHTAARSLAVELAPIRVNVVAPGVVRTPLWAGAPESLFADLGKQTLVGRVAEPADVAKVYAGLMDQDTVTGTIAVVDGGSVLV
jgi:NAD(P)-dependent dehydrogenase (short-subunit alcohol dehydrogenase family)